jgi:hypothetical protein
LLRGYDLTLRYNQVILVLSAVGALLGFILNDSAFWPRLYQSAVAGAAVFLAGALAKELDPDRPGSAPLAAMLTLAVAGRAEQINLVALLWLLACIRLINRSTGLRPKPIDIVALLLLAAWLVWRVGPLFGALTGGILIVDALLPDGRRLHAVIGAVVLIASTARLFLSNWSITSPELWLVLVLLVVAVIFIPVILSYSHVQAVGDATGKVLNPVRVQTGQTIALSAGLFFASWRGETGFMLLVALWTALLGIAAHYLILNRLRRPAASL